MIEKKNVCNTQNWSASFYLQHLSDNRYDRDVLTFPGP
jgi:hypothetical protein